MIDILRDIFEEKRYKILYEFYCEDGKCILFENIDEAKKEYFVLTSFKYNKENKLNSFLILNRVEKIFSHIVDSTIYQPEMDKNTSLLICLELRELAQEKNIKSIIYDIEEDPYYFKKYVITYTLGQVENYKENIINNKTHNKSVINLMESEIIDYNKFSLFKKNIYKPTLYNLISKLYIKIPFLNYNFQQKNIEDLEKNILDGMNYELNQLHTIILDMEPNIDIDSLKTKIGSYRNFTINDKEEDLLWTEIWNEIETKVRE